MLDTDPPCCPSRVRGNRAYWCRQNHSALSLSLSSSHPKTTKTTSKQTINRRRNSRCIGSVNFKLLYTARLDLDFLNFYALQLPSPHSLSRCVKVLDKAITMNNLRLLCLVKIVCRGTARRSRYKYSITTRFINSRFNAQYLSTCLTIV